MRKAGQILSETEKAKPSGANQHQDRLHDVTDPPTLNDLGVSKKQSSDWQKLADIPEVEFEAALADKTTKPTTVGIIRANAEPKPNPVSQAALWLWGRLLDFERNGILASTPAEVMATMTPEMLDDVHTDRIRRFAQPQAQAPQREPARYVRREAGEHAPGWRPQKRRFQTLN
jgi:hypothetical protein